MRIKVFSKYLLLLHKPQSQVAVNIKGYTVSKIINYFKDVQNELVNKTSWPTWPELQNSAMVVMVASAIIGLVVFGMDFIFEHALGWIYKQL